MTALRLRSRRRGLAFATLLAALAIAPRAVAATPLVFAAASLQTALDEIVQDFTRETGITVSVSYAGTSTLARQIEQGAPADIFISADLDWMDYVEARGIIDPATRTDLLGNRLVLIAPLASTVAIHIDADPIVAALGPDDRIAMADVEAVPAGRYGKAALIALGEWDAVEPHVAQADNVRAALAFVALGETPLGIVYATDAAAEPRVRIVDTFAEDLHPPIIYPAAMVADGANAEALQFFTYLRSENAAAIFIRNGFAVLSPGP